MVENDWKEVLNRALASETTDEYIDFRELTRRIGLKVDEKDLQEYFNQLLKKRIIKGRNLKAIIINPDFGSLSTSAQSSANQYNKEPRKHKAKQTKASQPKNEKINAEEEDLPITFYAVGCYWGENNDQTNRFLKEEIWENGNDDNYHNVVNAVRVNDVLVLKATEDEFFRVKAIGTVKENPRDGKKLNVKWFDPYTTEEGLNRKTYIDIEGPLNNYKRTIAKINDREHIHEIFAYLPKISLEIQRLINDQRDLNIENEAVVDIKAQPDNDVLGTEKIARLFLDMISRSSTYNEPIHDKFWPRFKQRFTEFLIYCRIKRRRKDPGRSEQFYGIFGRWGRGKTYFWERIKVYIREKYRKEFVPVEFHAWKYQDTPATWVYLYETLVQKYYSKPSNGVFAPIKYIGYYARIVWLNYHRGNIFAPVVLILSIIGTIAIFLIYKQDFKTDLSGSIVPLIGGSLSSIVVLISLYKTLTKNYSTKAKQFLKQLTQKVTYVKHLGVQHEIQKEIESLLNAWVGVSKKRILLFIDDIDRCNEQKIIDIVDSIRVMLEEKYISHRIVVLAAIDENILEYAIKMKYENYIKLNPQSTNGTMERLVKEYMDKLFISSIKLHPLNPSEKKQILMGFLENRVKKVDPFSKQNQTTSFTNGLDDSQNKATRVPDFKFVWDQSTYKIIKHDQDYQLTLEEYLELQDLITKYEDATPRIVRSFGIRYRLGKNIISMLIGNNGALLEEWHDKEFKSKKIFAQQLLKKIKGEKISRGSTSVELFDKISQSLEMVVPY